MKKKILFFIPTLGSGGAEKVLLNFVNNLDEEKFDITLLLLFNHGANLSNLSDKVNYEYIFPKVFRGNIYLFRLFSRRKLYKLLIKKEYDIMVSFLEGPTTRILSGTSNPNAILYNWIHTEVTNKNEFLKVYNSKKEMRKTYERFNKTFFVSDTVKKTFMSKFNEFQISGEIKYNPIDINLIKIMSEQKMKFIFNKEKINIVSVGRLTQVKGYMRLLKIAKSLLSIGNDNFVIYIIGEGSERSRLESFISNNDLKKNVKIIGYLENPYPYIKNADLYVCSSYKEGYNSSVVEAVTLEVPVLTTDCSGMSEILLNNKFGWIVDNNSKKLQEKMLSLITDPALIINKKIEMQDGAKWIEKNNSLSNIEELFLIEEGKVNEQ